MATPTVWRAFLFGEEEEEPITHEIDRRANKAAKRARQRSVVEEELDEFYMPQGMKPSTFQSTHSNIFKVKRDCTNKQVNIMIGEEEPATKKAAKRARQRSAKYGTTAVVEGA
jgi:DNA-directed RNA polymerase subunit K/omega